MLFPSASCVRLGSESIACGSVPYGELATVAGATAAAAAAAGCAGCPKNDPPGVPKRLPGVDVPAAVFVKLKAPPAAGVVVCPSPNAEPNPVLGAGVVEPNAFVVDPKPVVVAPKPVPKAEPAGLAAQGEGVGWEGREEWSGASRES